MTIPRETQLEIIGYLVATSGKERNYFGEDGNVSKTSKVLSVPVAIVCEDDTCTEVEVYPDGTMEIMGGDGQEWLGDTADCYTDAEINKLFNAFYGMV